MVDPRQARPDGKDRPQQINPQPYPAHKLVFIPSQDIAPVAKGGEDEDDLEQGGMPFQPGRTNFSLASLGCGGVT